MTKTYCRDCWFRSMAYRHAGSRERAGEIELLLERQGSRCALTGRVITPGIDASVDHIVPRSKGGKNDPPNLRWVAKRINVARSDMSDEAFIEMCRDVVAHADKK